MPSPLSGPILSDLLLYKWTDVKGRSRSLKIVESVSSKWWELGLMTGQNMEMLENYRQKTLNNNVECCKHVFNYWLNRPKNYPVTWDGLRDLLIDLEMKNVERTLRVALATRRYVTTSTTSFVGIAHCRSI